MVTCFILEASRPDGSEYRFVLVFGGSAFRWLSGIFGF